MRRMMMLMMLMAGTVLRAQEAPATQPDVRDRVLPELRFDDVSFNDMVDFLRDVTGANLMTYSDPGIPAGLPRVTAGVRDVTFQQWLQYLQSVYGVTIEEISGKKGNIILLLHVTMTPAVQAQMEPSGTGVRVFRLSDIISQMNGGDQEKSKDSMNAVLSLIQAAIELSGGAKPTLNAHEPTQTVLFNGSLSQAEIIEQTLGVLRQTDSHWMRAAQAADDQARALQVENSNLKARLRQLETTTASLNRELTKLQLESQMRERGYSPSTQPKD